MGFFWNIVSFVFDIFVVVKLKEVLDIILVISQNICVTENKDNWKAFNLIKTQMV